MKRNQIIIITLLVATAILARTIPGARTIDDSFITFRYARNLLEGNGFVFNPGEHVQGTTTPLYMLLMAGVGVFAGGKAAAFPQIALIVNALADSITCLLLYLIGKRLGSALAGISAGFAWALAPFSVTFAIGGLETSVYILLLTGAVWFHLAKSRKMTALLAVLSILTRPDAVILIGPLILDRVYQARFKGERIHLSEVLLFLLPGLVWGAFAWVYFGSFIPHSVQAKLGAYRLEALSSFIRILQHYALVFMQNSIIKTAPAIGIGLVLVPFFYIIGAVGAVRSERSIWPYALYPWLYLLVFSLPNPLIFRWYLSPPTPVLFLLVLMGAENVLTRILQKRTFARRQRSLKYIGGALIFLVPLVLNLSNWSLHPDHGPDRPAPEMAWYKLELLYRQVAEEISPMITNDTLLAAGDVGVLGFYTPARILDTVGLNSPQSLKYYPIPAASYVINYAIPTELLLQENPDWIVVLEVYGRNTFLQDERFFDTYRLWKEIPTDIYGSKGLLILTRKEPV